MAQPGDPDVGTMFQATIILRLRITLRLVTRLRLDRHRDKDSELTVVLPGYIDVSNIIPGHYDVRSIIANRDLHKVGSITTGHPIFD